MAGKLLTVRLSDAEREALRAAAEAAGSTVTGLVRTWINQSSSEGAGPAQSGAGVPTVLAPGPLAPPPEPVRPSFLAAPDDDCLACGHDRQNWHLTGRCMAPVGRRNVCACPAFLEAF